MLALAAMGGHGARAQPPGDGGGDGEERSYDEVRFDAHIAFSYYLGVGIGARVDFPVVASGLIDGADDDLRVGVGVDAVWFVGDPSGLGALPVLALQWNFYVSDEVSVFPEIGAALLFVPGSRILDGFVAPLAAFGVRYHLNARNALFMRLGWPTALHLGLVF